MDYDLDLIAGQTVIRFWLCRVDDNGLPVEADAKPTTATVDKNGTTLTLTTHYTISVADWNSTKGYLVTITLVTALVTNDSIAVFMNAAYTAVTKYFAAGGTAVPAAGGDATLANQTTILSYLTGGQVTVTSPVVAAGLIETVEGVTYDGTSEAKLFWTVAKDYTGRTITLYAWRNTESSDGTITKTMMKTATGAVASSTRVEIASLVSTFDSAIEYSGCPEPSETLRFSLIATTGGADEEIDRGEWIVYQGADS